MDFSWALSALKAGHKVTCTDWKNRRFLWLKPAVRVEAAWCHDPVLKELAAKVGGIAATPTISTCFKDPGGAWMISTGWVPQQEDLFAENWMEYPVDEKMYEGVPEDITDTERKRRADAMLDDAKRKEAFLKDLDKELDKLPKAGSMENCELLSNAINQLLDRVTCMPNLVASVQQGPEDKEVTITIREKSSVHPETYNVFATQPIHVEGETQRIRFDCSVDSEGAISSDSIGGYDLNDKVEG